MRRFDSIPFALVLITLVLLVACGGSPESSEAPADSAPPPATEPSESAPTAADEAAQAGAEDPLLPNAMMPESGLLLGGQPSVDQLDRIAAAGYTTVVNLRGDDEEGQLPPEAYEERGLEVVRLPVTGAEDVDEENARRLGELIDDPENRPLVVHCGSGNRVGALIALDAYHADGAAPEEALQIGLDAGMTRLEPVVRERLGLPASEEAESGDAGATGDGPADSP